MQAIKQMQRRQINPNDFSNHLFWDVDKTKLDLEKHQTFFVQRVLEYGLIADWHLIVKYYGIRRIGEISTKLRSLEPKSLSFISALSKIPLEKFRCYTTKQSIPPHWNF